MSTPVLQGLSRCWSGFSTSSGLSLGPKPFFGVEELEYAWACRDFFLITREKSKIKNLKPTVKLHFIHDVFGFRLNPPIH